MTPQTNPLLYRGLHLLDTKFDSPYDMFVYWSAAGKWRRDEPQIENCGNWMDGMAKVFRPDI